MKTSLLIFSGLLIFFSCSPAKNDSDIFLIFTDTLIDFAIIYDSEFIMIGKDGKVLHTIYPFENGPDYESEGTMRIVKDGLIGYINSRTAEVIVKPQYECAFPFEDGLAKVSLNCQKIKHENDEHTELQSQEWFYIDRTGKRVN
ncbi:MAG: WG repeat-containing protein [Flavobacteriia bacterium]|nr:WG repeat-containing protein [Flavobacteriia bacterium]